MTVRDIACSKSVEKKSAGRMGKMGNFHLKNYLNTVAITVIYSLSAAITIAKTKN